MEAEEVMEREELKRLAGYRAAEYVADGTVVGLGTGSTTAYTIEALGARVREGLRIRGIPTSVDSERLAREVGIPLTSLEECPEVDLTIDGADEVDRQGNLIKGRGGGRFSARRSWPSPAGGTSSWSTTGSWWTTSAWQSLSRLRWSPSPGTGVRRRSSG